MLLPIIQRLIAKLFKLPLFPKSVILLTLLLAALKGYGKVNQILQDSLIVKERLTQFDGIHGKLESCWTSLRELTLYLGCLTNDDNIMAAITYLLSSCFLQQQDLPPIECNRSIHTVFCIPPMCPHKCATHHSEKFSKQIGFNVYQVIHEGIQKFCYQAPKKTNSEILKMKFPWDQITITLTKTQNNALTVTNSDSKRMHHLKNILLDLVQTENISRPFKISKIGKSKERSESVALMNIHK